MALAPLELKPNPLHLQQIFVGQPTFFRSLRECRSTVHLLGGLELYARIDLLLSFDPRFMRSVISLILFFLRHKAPY